jgi:hypothetical protein
MIILRIKQKTHEMQTIVHYGLHLIFPIVVAFILQPKHWLKVYLIFLSSMIIDLDHLFAVPIFDPQRCSIGFHLLHTYTAIFIYIILLNFSKIRTFTIAILFHIITDFIDCIWTYSNLKDIHDLGFLHFIHWPFN